MSIVAAGPLVGDHDVRFVLPDPERRLRRVWLYQELRRPRLGPPLRRPPGGEGWTLAWRRGGVDRMEYLFRVEHGDGRAALVTDPGNPLRAEGAFGAKSVVEFPGYQPPSWLDGNGHGHGTVTPLTLPSPSFGADLPAVAWAPRGTDPDAPLPLLVVHDGPDYDAYAGLLRCLGRAVAAGRLPPLRAALLAAPDRNERYSASPRYAAALRDELLPALRDELPVPPGRRWLAGMGASLGALALLHAQRTAGAPFGGLYLQSGSFFLDRDRRVEGGFPRFERIRTFVAEVVAAPGRDGAGPWPPVPVGITCGLVEENLAGNRAVAGALRALGHPVAVATRPDAHNWVAWRDAFEPHLLPFLRALWGGAAP
jgi:enterochelin esterase family protein